MNINKTKSITIRFQELDYEMIRKNAAKEMIRPTEYLRNMIRKQLKEKLKSL
jgi:predicted DNA binding CopG/RHH family protein